MDLGAQTSPDELDDVRGLVQDNSLPAVVILPEGLSAERGSICLAIGATVLVRPYRPSELYAALWPGEPAGLGSAVDEKPLTVEPEPVEPEPDTARVPSADEKRDEGTDDVARSAKGRRQRT